MDDSTITYIVLGAAVALFVWDQIPVALIAIGVALALWATGVLEREQALAGFGDPTVGVIASLFVVSEGLEVAGVTSWVGQQLVERVGASQTRLFVYTMVLVALLTALINVNGAVAALVPVAVVLAVRTGRSPSQLLLPLAFGAHAGSLLMLTGTPVNVIISEASADAGAGRFGYFEFALVGLPLVVGVIAIVLLFGDRMLPERHPRSIAALAVMVVLLAGLRRGRDGRLPATVLMAVAVSAAASFLTPVATPANLMVMGPGGYRFGDYWKLGLPMLALFGIVAVPARPRVLVVLT